MRTEMRRRGKRCGKSARRRGGHRSGGNKENCFEPVFCGPNFVTKTTEPASRRRPSDNMTSKNTRVLTGREEPVGKRSSKRGRKKRESPETDSFEKNGNSPSPNTKISSVAFFIPLDGSVRHDPTNYTVERSDLPCSQGNNAVQTFERDRKYKESTRNLMLQPLKTKYRPVSVSSTDSRDTVVCFENDDEQPEDCCTNDTANFTIHSAAQKLEKNSNLAKLSCSHATPLQQPKRVRFMDNTKLVTVHVMVAWNYAYRAARISPWEEVARDSSRFRLKIKSLESILNPVLTLEHREKIWETRMRENLEEKKI